MNIDETSTQILIYIRDNSVVSIETLYNVVQNKSLADMCVSSLLSKKLIEGLNYQIAYSSNGAKAFPCSPYKITADGLAYLENLKTEKTEIRNRFFRDLILALMGAFVGNADRLCPFIIDLIKNLLAE